MTLWFFNIDDFPDEKVQHFLSVFPLELEKKINRFKSIEDKKSRLIARLLVQKYFIDTNGSWDWNLWKTNLNHKPYIENGTYFNISHSGKIVIVAFSNKSEIGVDIEEIKAIDIIGISNNFHIDEIQHLKKNNYNTDLFYSIWTKKEAFLKAKGDGILFGINDLSILKDIVINNKKWYIDNVDFCFGYKCAVCTEFKAKINIKQIDYTTLSNLKSQIYSDFG